MATTGHTGPRASTPAASAESLGGEKSPQGKPNRVVKMLPRVALTIALVATAFLIPDLLSKSLSSGAQTTLTVSLIVTALTALFAPSDAISTVASDISGVGPPKSGQGK